MIRFAKAEDAAALLEIYAQYIDTPITFEYALPSAQQFAQRIAETRAQYPYLVCEEAGQIAGYAYAHRYGERAAYGWNAELSVYIRQDAASKGLGKKLYQMLIELLKLQGVKTVYGIVTVPNEKSEGLHAALGFRRLGAYHSTGYKCGKWHDVALFEKEIAPHETDPQPIVPITKVPEEKLQAVLQAGGQRLPGGR